MSATQSIDSPCVAICDTAGTDLCTGCFRTLDEIGGWSLASDEEKYRIIARAQARDRLNNNAK